MNINVNIGSAQSRNLVKTLTNTGFLSGDETLLVKVMMLAFNENLPEDKIKRLLEKEEKCSNG